jgi:hypothetical protein
MKTKLMLQSKSTLILPRLPNQVQYIAKSNSCTYCKVIVTLRCEKVYFLVFKVFFNLRCSFCIGHGDERWQTARIGSRVEDAILSPKNSIVYFWTTISFGEWPSL